MEIPFKCLIVLSRTLPFIVSKSQARGLEGEKAWKLLNCRSSKHGLFLSLSWYSRDVIFSIEKLRAECANDLSFSSSIFYFSKDYFLSRNSLLVPLADSETLLLYLLIYLSNLSVSSAVEFMKEPWNLRLRRSSSVLRGFLLRMECSRLDELILFRFIYRLFLLYICFFSKLCSKAEDVDFALWGRVRIQ